MLHVVLAVFGFTYLLRYQDGPKNLLKNIRKMTGILYVPVISANGAFVEEIEEIPEGKFIAGLFGCFWCLATWVSFVFVAVHLLIGQYIIVEWFFWSFASVGISGFVHDTLKRFNG